MGLRTKTALTITLIFISVIVGTYLLFSTVLLNAFTSVERERAFRNSERAVEAIENVTTDLRTRTNDWAHWDDTYAFLKGENPEYLTSNVNYEALVPFELLHLVYLNLEGRAIYTGSVSQDTATISPLASTTLDTILTLPAVSDFIAHPSRESRAGLTQINGRAVFLAMATITDNNPETPPVGFLIFTRDLSEKLQSQLRKQTRLDLLFTPAHSNTTELAHGTRKGSMTVVESGDSLSAIATLPNIDGASFLDLSFTTPREIYQEGKSARNYLIFLMVLFLFVANCVVLFFVHRVVLGPLMRLIAKISLISSTEDLSMRVSAEGRDEFGTLANRFNELLTVIEHTNHELTRAREAALAANEAKSIFIAKVSHELRTPIHSITGMLKILCKEEASPVKRSYITMASEAAYGLLSIINGILDFSKVEADKLTFERIECSIRDIAREALRTVLPRAEEKPSLELLFDIDPIVPDRVIGDPLRITQVLVNLLGNAIKFTQQGAVTLRISATDVTSTHAQVVLQVNDTGIGIPADRLPHIFEPFTQADNSVTRLYAGTGLGLTIAKQIVQGLEGTITVVSEIDRGTTFSVKLPFELCGTPSRSSTPTISPPRVAIIDAPSLWGSYMQRAMQRYDIVVDLFDAHETSTLQRVAEMSAAFGLFIVTSAALKRSAPFNLLIDVAVKRHIPLVVVLSPHEIALRERLTALNIQHILTRPLSAEDILTSLASGQQNSLSTWREEDAQLFNTVSPLKIIVADDTATNRIILASMLEDAGHSVVCVENGAELLDKLVPRTGEGSPPTERFDLVLTDIQMPFIDGLTVTRRVRDFESTSEASQHIPIVAVTAHALQEEDEEMRMCGIDDVITKPIDPKHLARIINQTAQSRRARQSKASGKVGTPLDSTAVEELQIQATRLLESIASTTYDGSEPFLDINDIYVRSGESLRRTKLILRAFLSSFKEPLLALTNARSNRSTEQLKKAAHTLKGLTLDIGAKHTADILKRIETACRDGRPDDGYSLVGACSEEILLLARVCERLTEEGRKESQIEG